MVNYRCKICNKEFKKKCNFDYHIGNKKRPCEQIIKEKNDFFAEIPPNPAKIRQKSRQIPPKSAKNAEKMPKNAEKLSKNPKIKPFFPVENVEINLKKQINLKNPCFNENLDLIKNTENPCFNEKSDLIKNTENPCFNGKSDLNNIENTNNIFDMLLKNPILDQTLNNDKIICIYCEKIFTRTDSLKKHQNGRCKSKLNYDEFEEIKQKMNLIINNYENFENHFQKLENNYQQLIKTNKNDKPNINNNTKIINNNNNSNNNINNGIINTINIVQFGEEDINKINLPEAVRQYLNSTGGNIASNMLKYINLNEKYPENHNICITDISRELVKIHNGKKFVIRKFKTVKNDIMKNVAKNTRKIMDNYEKDDKIKKNFDIKNKLRINEISLKLIDGYSGEEIVRDEIREKLKNNKMKLNKNTDNSEYSESEEDRDFTFEERLRITHLDNKREGLQIKTFENIKEELYNAKELLNPTFNFKK